MRKTVFALLASVLFVPFAFAATGDDVAAPVLQFIDAFNKGNTAAGLATYAQGEITIVDEFAPRRWSGPRAAQEWAADYDKHAKATGVTDGLVKYGSPTRIEVEGDLAYVILPTEYLYKEHVRRWPRRDRSQPQCTRKWVPGKFAGGRGQERSRTEQGKAIKHSATIELQFILGHQSTESCSADW